MHHPQRQHIEYRVISLAGSERLPKFLAQPGAAPFRVFEAIDTRDGTVPDTFDTEAFIRRNHRPPLPGEIGCALSHVEVLREFSDHAADRDILVVAEDDALLSSRFMSDFPIAIKVAKRADIVMFGTGLSVMDGPFFDRSANWLTFSPLGHRALRLDPLRILWVGLVESTFDLGTICYSVTGRAAKRILQLAESGVNWVSDDFRIYKSLGLRIYHVRPYLAQQDPFAASGIRPVADQPIETVATWRTRTRIRTRMARFAPALSLGIRDFRGRIAR